MALRGLERVGYVQGQDNQQRGIAAGGLAQHIDRVIGTVAKLGSHTFDPSTGSITCRIPVDRVGERSPTRLVGPRIQLELRGRGSRPAGRRAGCLAPNGIAVAA